MKATVSLNRFDYSLRYTLIGLVSIWTMFLIQQLIPAINLLGIKPRTFSGLLGIILAPFLHVDIKHLINNSISFLFIGLFYFYFYRKYAFVNLFLAMLLTGLGTWIIADIATVKHIHIGLSGLIYFMTFFMLVSGMIRKNKKLMIISLLLIFLYGGMIWGIMPFEVWEYQNVSWEGHLAGALTGIIFAYFNRKVQENIFRDKVYSWQLQDDLQDSEPYWMPEYWAQKQEAQKIYEKQELEAYYRMLENWS